MTHEEEQELREQLTAEAMARVAEEVEAEIVRQKNVRAWAEHVFARRPYLSNREQVEGFAGLVKLGRTASKGYPEGGAVLPAFENEPMPNPYARDDQETDPHAGPRDDMRRPPGVQEFVRGGPKPARRGGDQ